MNRTSSPMPQGRTPGAERPRPPAVGLIERPGHCSSAERLAVALEMQQRHQTQGLRIKEDHALVLLTMRHLQPNAVDVSALYKMLLDEGHVVPLSRLYRILKVLEEIDMVQHRLEAAQGRPRRFYGLTATGLAGGDAAAPVCTHCGAPLA